MWGVVLSFLRGRALQIFGAAAIVGLGAFAIERYRSAIEQRTAAEIRTVQLEQEISDLRKQRAVETQELVRSFDAALERQKATEQAVEDLRDVEDGPAAPVLNQALEALRK